MSEKAINTPTKLVFTRQGSKFNESNDPKASSTNAVDPRSPGVPRTPSAHRKVADSVNSPKASSKSASVPEPVSPLANFITQTDASGTPTHRPKQVPQERAINNGTPLSKINSGVAAGGGKGEGDVGGVTNMLCCCWQPNDKDDANGEGRSNSKDESSKKKNSKKPVFNSFHYDDPAHPAGKPILPPVAEKDKGKMCLVLDLDETLVHSSFRAVPNPDYIIPVQIEDVVHHVYVCKRPGVDEYLRRCGERYEVVIYTASLNKYADPLLNKLDKHGVIRHRLFRESCTQYQGNYVKNLNLLGRDLRTCIIVDNSPLSYLFHPENAVGCISWIDQQDDDELRVIQDFCEVIENEEDIRYHMRHWKQGKDYDVKSAFN